RILRGRHVALEVRRRERTVDLPEEVHRAVIDRAREIGLNWWSAAIDWEREVDTKPRSDGWISRHLHPAILPAWAPTATAFAKPELDVMPAGRNRSGARGICNIPLAVIQQHY